jgi:hypothetical protein
MSLDRDLARWEIGEISPEELERLHPDAAVAALVALHERLSTIAHEGVPDAEAAMERMLQQLPDRAQPAQRRSSRVLLLAAAAVLLTASMAVAMPGVRSSVSGLAHGVGRLFGADPVSPPSPEPAAIDRAHPGTSGGGRGVDEQRDIAGSHEPGSGDGDDQGGDPSETSGSADDQGGSSGTSGGESSGGDGGSNDQGGDGQGSDGENTGGGGADEGSQTTDGQMSDGQTQQD